jgi:cytochrome c oxidase subunit 2
MIALAGGFAAATVRAGIVGLPAARILSALYLYAFLLLVGAFQFLAYGQSNETPSGAGLGARDRRKFPWRTAAFFGLVALLLAGGFHLVQGETWGAFAFVESGPLGVWPAAVLTFPGGSISGSAATVALWASFGVSLALILRIGRRGRRSASVTRIAAALGPGLFLSACPLCVPLAIEAASWIGILPPESFATVADPMGPFPTWFSLFAVLASACAIPYDPPAPPWSRFAPLGPVVAASWWALPSGASTTQNDIYNLYILFLVIAIFTTVVSFGWLFYYLWKYRASSFRPRPPLPKRRTVAKWQIFFVVAPTILLGILGAASEITLQATSVEPPADALGINVTAMQWAWRFGYANGTETVNHLYLPLGVPVEFNVTTDDVAHSFFIPDLGVRQDAVPQMVNHQTITATAPGVYQGECAEFCGIGHPTMRFDVTVR